MVMKSQRKGQAETKPSKGTEQKKRKRASGRITTLQPVSRKEIKKGADRVLEKTSDLVSIVTFDVNPVYTYVNPSHKTTLGYAPENLIGKHALDLMHPDDRKEMVPLLETYVQAVSVDLLPTEGKGITEKIEYRFKDQWGGWRYLETTGDLLDRDHILFISRDMTERKRFQKELEAANQELERRVEERTAELVKKNALLVKEIAERRRAEEALRESQERIRELAEMLPETIFETDRNGRLSFVNREAFEKFGFRQKDFEEGLNACDMVVPEDRERARRTFRSVLEGHQSGLNEYRALRKDGSTFPVLIHSAPVLHQGNPTGVRGFIVDITERKKAEDSLLKAQVELEKRVEERTLELAEANAELRLKVGERIEVEKALRESEEKYRLLAETAREIILTLDLEGRITYLNAAALEISGYEKEELIGKNVNELLPKDQLPLFRERLTKRLGGQKGSLLYETVFLAKDGSRISAEVSSSPILKKDTLLGILISARDITKKKRMEKALSETEEKYRILVENANEAIFIIQDRQVKFPNKKARKIGAYLGVDFEKVPLIEYIHPEERKMVLDRTMRMMAGERFPDAYSFRLVGKEERTMWVELSAVLIPWEDKPASLCFLRDITHQKEIESRLQHLRRMEALGTLAGGIAHDFNNLLMGIQGRVSLMLLDVDSSHPHHDELISMEEIVKSGADLTKQLLGFARGGKYEVKPTNLNGLIIKTSSMFARTRRDIGVHKDFEKDIWTVEIDRGQIEQVLLNLFMNAWQAMPDGGEISIQTENVVLAQSEVEPLQLKPGRFVRVSVTDTGIGMDEATRQRIFEPFFSTREMGRGTGLGLASTYGIVKSHHGMIEVHSKKGEGTTFHIYLPASEKQPAEERESTEEALRGRETILLVDDEEMVLGVSGKVLQKLGYTVLSARNGREALDIFRRRKTDIDIVVLDMTMPLMGGGETFDQLKALRPEIKVLLSTGYSIEGEASEILARGCDGFIQKPFRTALLVRKIREILEKKG